MKEPSPETLTVPAGAGEVASLGALGVIFKVAAEQTGGAFTIVEHPMAPGALAPPHVHEREDELSYVLEGQVGFRLGDRDMTFGPGSYVVKPRGIPHAFWNAGAEPARIIEIIWPAGFEQYFRDFSRHLAAGPADPARVAELRARYGLSEAPGGEELATQHHLFFRGVRR